jgi:hypothetical protein
MEHSGRVAERRMYALVVGMALLAQGCLPHGLAFVKDDRVRIVSPESHATVQTPVTIRWQVNNFRITGPDGSSDPDAGYFGVFVDRAPVPPGKPLSYVANGDKLCLATPGCPDKQYLEDHDTYSTMSTSFTLRQLPDLSAYHGHELHEVTIVMLDGQGRRNGEQAWYIDFRYDRKGL